MGLYQTNTLRFFDNAFPIVFDGFKSFGTVCFTIFKGAGFFGVSKTEVFKRNLRYQSIKKKALW
jgi:hypothetical protein